MVVGEEKYSQWIENLDPNDDNYNPYDDSTANDSKEDCCDLLAWLYTWHGSSTQYIKNL